MIRIYAQCSRIWATLPSFKARSNVAGPMTVFDNTLSFAYRLHAEASSQSTRKGQAALPIRNCMFALSQY